MAQEVSFFRDTEATTCDHRLDKVSKKMRVGEIAHCRNCGKTFERVK